MVATPISDSPAAARNGPLHVIGRRARRRQAISAIQISVAAGANASTVGPACDCGSKPGARRATEAAFLGGDPSSQAPA